VCKERDVLSARLAQAERSVKISAAQQTRATAAQNQGASAAHTADTSTRVRGDAEQDAEPTVKAARSTSSPEAGAAPRTAAVAQADESTLDELQRLRRLLDRRDTSIEDAFTRADIDSSGDLTQAEWETAFGMSRALFARIDTDGDGKVSLKEFLDALARVPNSAGQLRQLLDKAQLVEVVAAHLEERAVREGGDAVCLVKEADPQTVSRALVGLELRMAAAVVAAAGCHKEDDAPNDGASGGVGSKFQSDLTTVAAYGSIADYNDSLNSLGVPQADVLSARLAQVEAANTADTSTRVRDTAGDDNDAEHRLLFAFAANPEGFFEHADTDVSGNLSEEEFTLACLDSVPDIPQAEQPFLKGASKELFVLFDKDHDGTISEDEFSQTIKVVTAYVQEAKCEVAIVAALLRMLLSAEMTEEYSAKRTEMILAELPMKDLVAALALRVPKQLVAHGVQEQKNRSIREAFQKEQQVNKGKFTSLPEAAYGDIEDFFRGFEVLGLPHSDILKHMMIENTKSADSDEAFDSWNSGLNSTTPIMVCVCVCLCVVFYMLFSRSPSLSLSLSLYIYTYILCICIYYISYI
jgi:Ca2+-binding EF-hand superfamily protein